MRSAHNRQQCQCSSPSPSGMAARENSLPENQLKKMFKSGTDLLTVTSTLLFIIFPILYYDNYDTMITKITV